MKTENEKHKLYDNFKTGEEVYVLPPNELEHLLSSKYTLHNWQYDYYIKSAGLKTKIYKKFYHCCILDFDVQYTWSYNWINKKPKEHFDNNLFEI